MFVQFPFPIQQLFFFLSNPFECHCFNIWWHFLDHHCFYPKTLLCCCFSSPLPRIFNVLRCSVLLLPLPVQTLLKAMFPAQFHALNFNFNPHSAGKPKTWGWTWLPHLTRLKVEQYDLGWRSTHLLLVSLYIIWITVSYIWNHTAL